MKIVGQGELCNENAYKEIYLSYSKGLYRFLTYSFGDSIDAEDITQNVFLKLWEECSKYRLDNIKSLIYTMGKNQSLNRLKRNKIKNEQPLPKAIDFQSPEYEMEEKQFKDQLSAAIGSLTENEKTVFLMSRIEDLGYKEIAERLEISQKTVEKRMHNALKNLNNRLSVNLKRK